MILEQETFEAFGYYPLKLKPQSEKPILAACDECGITRETSKHQYHALCNSCAKKGRIFTEEHKANISASEKGKKLTEETKARISAARKGEKCYNWKGGISFEPYCVKFNYAYKQLIRIKFSNKCFWCGMTTEENGEALSVHHVNYNRNCGCDGTECVCVPLCRSCHSKTNTDRDGWQEKIMKKLELSDIILND
jgi:hypothetical protein